MRCTWFPFGTDQSSCLLLWFYFRVVWSYMREWVLVSWLDGNLLRLQICEDCLVHVDLLICVLELFFHTFDLFRIFLRRLDGQRSVGFELLFVNSFGEFFILVFEFFDELSVDLGESFYFFIPIWRNLLLNHFVVRVKIFLVFLWKFRLGEVFLLLVRMHIHVYHLNQYK